MKKQSSNLFSEIASHYLDYMETSNKVPFDAIFGNKLRTIEPLYGKSSYQKLLKDLLGDQYEIDFEKWAGYKITDTEKKNPSRLGKILTKRKEELLKILSSAENEEYKQKLEINIKALDDLLKTTNLQKQYEQANPTADYVIYSRSPIDVARMSDFDWSSCHTPGRGHFYCALSDSRNLGAIAYLVSEEEYQTYELYKDENLQKQEIFKDNDRNIKGVNPQARIRIRLVNDSAGNELAVPNLKVYAPESKRYNNLFVQQVIDWAKKQDVSNFNWVDKLILRGGDYEDYGHEVKENIKKIWGEDIQYAKKYSDYDELRSDFGQEDDEAHWEEHLRDEIRENIREHIFDEVWTRLTGEEYDLSYPDISIESSLITIKIDLPKSINDVLVKNREDKNESYIGDIRENLNKLKNYDEKVRVRFIDYRTENKQLIHSLRIVADFPRDYDYIDLFELQNFSYSDYYDECAEICQKVINVSTGNLTSDFIIKNQRILPLKITENLFKIFEIPFNNSDQIPASKMIEDMNLLIGQYDYKGIKLGKYECDLPDKKFIFEKINAEIEDYIITRMNEFLPKLSELHSKLGVVYNTITENPEADVILFNRNNYNQYSYRRSVESEKDVEDYENLLSISENTEFIIIPHYKDDTEKSYITILFSLKGMHDRDLQELLLSANLKEIYKEYKTLQNKKELDKIIDPEKISQIVKQYVLKENENLKRFLINPTFKLFWEMKA